MGIEKVRRPMVAPQFQGYGSSGLFKDRGGTATQTLTSTASVLPLQGTVILNATGAGDKSFKLPTAALGGRVHVTAVDSTHLHTVTTPTTAATFFGTTFQNVQWSTALGYRAATFEAVGPSTGLKWHVVSKSTGATLS